MECKISLYFNSTLWNPLQPTLGFGSQQALTVPNCSLQPDGKLSAQLNQNENEAACLVSA